jgi:hypothetical protein
MESLAYVVMGILVAQILLGAVPLTFAILYRVKGKFAVTSQVLIALLALQMAWGFTLAAAFGYLALTFLVSSSIVRWVKFK